MTTTLNKHKGVTIKGPSCSLNPWAHDCQKGDHTTRVLKKAELKPIKEIFGYSTNGFCVLVTLMCPICGNNKKYTKAEDILRRIKA